VYKKNIAFQVLKSEKYFIIAALSKILLISCYFAPSESLEEQLNHVTTKLERYHTYEKILIGDFNVRSLMYEKLKTIDYNMKKRADLFEKFLMAFDQP